MKWLLPLYLQRRSDNPMSPLPTNRRGRRVGLSSLSELTISADFSALIFQLRTLARIHDLAWIDRGIVQLLLHDLAILADQKIHPPGGFVLVEVNPILTGGFATPIT